MAKPNVKIIDITGYIDKRVARIEKQIEKQIKKYQWTRRERWRNHSDRL